MKTMQLIYVLGLAIFVSCKDDPERSDRKVDTIEKHISPVSEGDKFIGRWKNPHGPFGKSTLEIKPNGETYLINYNERYLFVGHLEDGCLKIDGQRDICYLEATQQLIYNTMTYSKEQ